MAGGVFIPQYDNGTKETTAQVVTTGGTTANVKIDGPAVLLAFRTAAAYVRFGQKGVTVTASNGMWFPASSVIVMHKPEGATHMAYLQDTGAGDIHLQPGILSGS